MGSLFKHNMQFSCTKTSTFCFSVFMLMMTMVLLCLLLLLLDCFIEGCLFVICCVDVFREGCSAWWLS